MRGPPLPDVSLTARRGTRSAQDVTGHIDPGASPRPCGCAWL